MFQCRGPDGKHNSCLIVLNQKKQHFVEQKSASNYIKAASWNTPQYIQSYNCFPLEGIKVQAVRSPTVSVFIAYICNKCVLCLVTENQFGRIVDLLLNSEKTTCFIIQKLLFYEQIFRCCVSQDYSWASLPFPIAKQKDLKKIYFICKDKYYRYLSFILICKTFFYKSFIYKYVSCHALYGRKQIHEFVTFGFLFEISTLIGQGGVTVL